MKPFRTALAALAALALASPLSAQVIAGRVLDDISDQPVGEVTVAALAGDSAVAQARTGADGSYRMQLPAAGTYVLRAQRLGYGSMTTAPVQVAAGATVQVDIRVAAEEVVLSAVEGTGRVERRSPRLETSGFYERQKEGFGRFLTAEEIEKRNALEVTDLFRGIPGVRLIPSGVRDWQIIMSRGGSNCEPRIFVDNLAMTTADLEDAVQPEHIAGIEVYRGSSEIPARWGGSRASCGVIVIWTKVGNEP